MNVYTLLQIKKNNFIDEFKPNLIKTGIEQTHKWKQTYIYICVYIYTLKKKSHSQIHREK